MKNRFYNNFVDGLEKSVKYIGIITIIQVTICIICQILNLEIFTVMSVEEMIIATKNITILWCGLILTMAISLIIEWYYTG